MNKILKKTSKEIIYYTRDSEKSPRMLEACREQLRKSNLPIIYISGSPIKNVDRNLSLNVMIPDFNEKYVGFQQMFKKILIGLEMSTADYCFMAEDDVFYHPSHFDFTPPTNNMYYYNENVWHLRTLDGFAIFYSAKRLSQMCAERNFLIEHFRKRLKIIESLGKDVHWSRMGFEPGTHNRKERIDDFKAGQWMSSVPSIDIKDGKNATSARWSQKEFRDQRNCQNWKEADWNTIPGWDKKDFTFLQ